MHAVIITGVNEEGITLVTLALVVLPTVNNHSLALSHEAVLMELRGFARQYFNHLYVESFSESEKDAHGGCLPHHSQNRDNSLQKW